MPTYRLDVAYDGTEFHGYARQPDVRTVQGELEAALEPHTGPVDTFVAGRTDKGVHATGQVVSFAAGRLDIERVQRSLNKQLASEVSVLEMAEVRDDFHARFSASGRRYRYLLLVREAPDPFLARYSWHYPTALDPAGMNDAAAGFLGELDFASLCRKAGEASTTRRVDLAHWREADPGLLEYRVEASSFCHQMVRSMVAVCVDVGRGMIPASDVAPMLAAGDRSASRGAAPPHGLTLVGVEYDGEWSGDW